MELTKICIRCGDELPLVEFYKHKQMADGHLNKCKKCARSDSAKRESRIRSTPEGVESERKRHKEKYHRLKYKDRQKEWDSDKPWKSTSEYRNLNRDIRRKGVDMKGKSAHHWCYNNDKLRSIFIISLNAHKKVHKHLVFIPDARIFSFNGIPLTSKERHFGALLDIFEIENIKESISSVTF